MGNTWDWMQELWGKNQKHTWSPRLNRALPIFENAKLFFTEHEMQKLHLWQWCLHLPQNYLVLQLNARSVFNSLKQFCAATVKCSKPSIYPIMVHKWSWYWGAEHYKPHSHKSSNWKEWELPPSAPLRVVLSDYKVFWAVLASVSRLTEVGAL